MYKRQGDKDVARFEEGADFFADFGSDSFALAGGFDKRLFHFGDGGTTDAEEVKHDLGVAGAGAAVKGGETVGEEAGPERASLRIEVGFFFFFKPRNHRGEVAVL